MYISGGVLVAITDDDVSRGRLVIPDSVVEIPSGFSDDCRYLTQVDMSDTVQKISHCAFQNRFNLEKINLSQNLERIGYRAFSGCSSLQELDIPKSVKTLYLEAFGYCSSLNKVVMHEGLEEVKEKTFTDCQKLQRLEFPDSVREIGKEAMSDCASLNFVKLPKSLEKLSNQTFKSCTALEVVQFQEGLKAIEERAFERCFSLGMTTKKGERVVEIPDSVLSIGEGAFSTCLEMTAIKLPKHLKIISSDTFKKCVKLKEITLPEDLQRIDSSAFLNCKSLKNINFNENLEVIEFEAFDKCSALERLEFPESLKVIEEDAFWNCPNLKEVVLPSSIEKVNFDAFDFKNFKYLVKVDDKMILTSNKKYASAEYENSRVEIDEYNSHIVNLMITNWDVKDKIMQDCEKSAMLESIYLAMYEDMEKSQFSNFVNDKNLKFFKNVKIKDIENDDYCNYVKLFYNLGGFNSKPTEVSYVRNDTLIKKQVDYAQKTGEFLKEAFASGRLKFSDMNDIFSFMDINEFSPGFADFFMKDLDALMAEEMKSEGFISRCYNEFDKVQKSNTSNKGKQRQLKPTVSKFREFFQLEDIVFNGVDKSNLDLALELLHHLSSPTQEEFDDALKIYNMVREQKLPDNIISQETIDNYGDLNSEKKYEVLETQINKVDSEIFDTNREIMDNIIDTVENKYSYEWLKKSDIVNFVLGKLCSCCAHLQGVGYGIMHASIVHPDVQNLAIKDPNGKIVAKSTLYINRKEGYGVFNNVEVNFDVPEEDYPKIYEEYKKGVARFAKLYNLENPENPLKQINVGMGSNDLDREIATNDTFADEVLPAIDYGLYGKGQYCYSGDSMEEQFVVWNKDKEGKDGRNL